MFKTSKVESGTIKVTSETEAGDVILTIKVEGARVIEVDVDVSQLENDILGNEASVYNHIVGALLPRLIDDGVL